MSKERGTSRGPKRVREERQYVFSDYEGLVWLHGLAIGAALAGGACRIGLTRDGGALAIGLYMGDDYGTEYVRPGDDLGEEIRAIAAAWSIAIPIWDDEAGQYVLPARLKTASK